MKVELSTGPTLDEAQRKEQERKRLWESCQGFEAFFLESLLKGLRKTIPKEGGFQERVFTSIFDEHIAKACSKRGLGLGKLMYERLVRDLGLGEEPKNPKVSPKTAEIKNEGVNPEEHI